MNTKPITPAFVLATAAWLDSLPPHARAVLPYMADVWLRPEQRVDFTGLRELGFLAGRAWGKTFAAAYAVYRVIELHGAIAIGVMAPTEEVAKSVPFQALIEVSPPWNKPTVRGDRLIWPNGATARLFTAQQADHVRGQNFHVFWFTELVAFPTRSILETWNIAAATTRKGLELLIWDSTSRDTNVLIERRLAAARENPAECRVIRGKTFDNPLRTTKYLRSLFTELSGQRLREEVYGETFDKAAGALWGREEIAARRVAPADVPRLELKLMAHDPALSESTTADETGLVGAGRASDGGIYILRDDSCPNDSRIWGPLILDAHEFDGYAGIVAETNRVGNVTLGVLTGLGEVRKIRIVALGKDEPFRPYRRGVFQVRNINTQNSKVVRGDSARAFANVHHAGTFDELEEELTTYAGTGPSPGRFDAFNYVVNELAGLSKTTKAPPPEQIGYGAIVDRLRGSGSRRAI